MSNFQINKIQKLLKYDTKEAEHLMQLMDETGDQPDWSEFSNKQFESHFKMILTGY